VAGPFNTGNVIDGGDSPVNEVNPLEGDAAIADLVSLILALKSIDPDLEAAYQAYIVGNKALVIANVKKSKFYQNFNKTARERAIIKKEQFGVWTQDLNKYKLEQKKRLVAAGIQWTPSIEKQVESAYDLGLDNNTLDTIIIKAKDFGKIGGAQLGSIDALKEFADSYGVLNMYNDSYWNTQKEKLFLGEITSDDIQNDIKDMAKQVYPGFAAGFDVGQSLAAQTGYIKNTVAKVTGIDPNALKYDDPMVSAWYQYKDPKTGAFTRPPQYLVEQGTKEKYFDLYAKTPSGTAYLDGLTLKVLQDMGLM
jgi:hypothetical protein